MTYVNLKQNRGFTLVELAIVLIIIGLIVSSVLVGQDLIKAAELRATVRQYDQFQAATNTFYEKYSQMPGDADTSKFGLAGDTTYGNENGILESSGAFNAANATPANRRLDGEIANFWSNLTTPGKELLPGGYAGHSATATNNNAIGVAIPSVKAAGGFGWGVLSDGNSNFYTTGVVDDTTIAYDTSDIFVPIDAFNIDNKIDDGVPTTGTIQAVDGNATPDPFLQTGATFLSTTTNTTSCANSTPTPDEYQFSATSALCNLIFDMSSF